MLLVIYFLLVFAGGVLGKIQGAISHVNGHKPQAIPLYIILGSLWSNLQSAESLWLLHALALTILRWNSPMHRQENLQR